MKSIGIRAGLSCAVVCVWSTAAVGQLRIVDYNIAQLGGNQAHLQAVFAALNTDDKDGFAVTPAIYLFQEVLIANKAPLLAMVNAAAPPGVTYDMGTYTSFSGEDAAAGAEAIIYRTNPPIVTEILNGHTDVFTGAGRYADRWKIQLNGYTSPNALLYIYDAHLKASNTPSDASTRLTGATNIRSDSDSHFPAGTRIMYCGDFNLYSNSEAAYIKFLSAGNGQAVDPLGSGPWSGATPLKLTQSPCLSCPGMLVGGGLDDRFDFQLTTQALQNGTGLAIMSVPSAYRTFGNDGNHYNQSINNNNNTYYPADIPRSNALANNLVDATDHLPVVVDFQLPAVMSATLPGDAGRVIQGTPTNVTLQVSNTANVVIASGADSLAFSAVGTGAVSGTAGGSVQALNPPATGNFAIDTSTVGAVSGSVQVSSSSDGVQNPFIELFTGATVLRHSSGSFSNASSVIATTVGNAFSANSGLQAMNVSIYNLGFDASQALLDVDSVSGIASPFTLGGGLASGIGGTPAILQFSFDTTGAAGDYSDIVTINISDENIPGATSGTLTLTLNVHIGTTPGDINCDGNVDLADASTLADVLVGADLASCHLSQADVDANGVRDGRDIAAFVSILLGP